jgi:3-isopropylmalate/(R)-2-methylmalate dehydratase small subunit
LSRRSPVGSRGQTMKETFKGKCWIVGDNVDTDQIYHGQWLPITDPKEMAKHALENVKGFDFEQFSNQVEQGDILIAGRNFGSGSSREHAPVSIQGGGIGLIIAESFSRIFYRNAINIGLPLIECPGISIFAKTGDLIEANAETGKIRNLTQNTEIDGHPLSGLERDIMESGGLLEYLKTHA